MKPIYFSVQTVPCFQMINNAKKNKQPLQSRDFGNSKKSLGPRRGPGKFVPPVQQDEDDAQPHGKR